MATIAQTWDRIHTWLEINSPKVLECLRPGASHADIRKLQDRLEINEFPEDFTASYRIHNGSDTGLFFGGYDTSNSFHSTDDIFEDWSVNKEIYDRENFKDWDRTGDECIKIQYKWWDPRWISFGNNGSGDCICLDLAPAEAGSFGQVIQWYHDGAYNVWFAANFAEFLEKYADALEANIYKLSEDGSYLELKEYYKY